MENLTLKLFCVYVTAISVVAVIMTIMDKIKAQKHRWRIPEATLMTVGLLGGALSMYVTMRIIHHKTHHSKFMIGLPIICVMHALLIIGIYINFYV